MMKKFGNEWSVMTEELKAPFTELAEKGKPYKFISV